MKPISASFEIIHEDHFYRVTFDLNGLFQHLVSVDRDGEIRWARNPTDRGREYKPCVQHCGRLIELWDQLLTSPPAGLFPQEAES